MNTQHICGLAVLILMLTSFCISVASETAGNEDVLQDDDYYDGEEEDEDEDYDNGIYVTLNASFSDDLPPTTAKIILASLPDLIVTTAPTTPNLIDIPKIELTCPEECECLNEFQFVNCSNRGLGAVPKDFPFTAMRIDLSYNSIVDLQQDAFENCTDLRELILTGNKISIIRKEVFTNLTKLNYIDLAHNELTEIDPNAFSEATNLLKLTLNHNSKIRFTAEDSSLLNQPKLQELHLRNCSLAEIHDNAFRNLSNLLVLTLDHNNFRKKINTKAFEPLKNLSKLQLTELDQDSVKELCNILTNIDVINFKNFDVSCFELASGSSFEESLIIKYSDGSTMRPPTKSQSTKSQQEKENYFSFNSTENTSGEENSDSNDTNHHDGDKENINSSENNNPKMNSSVIITEEFPPTIESLPINGGTQSSSAIGKTAITNNPTEGNNSSSSVSTSLSEDNESKTYQMDVSRTTINQMLIGIMIFAVLGIIIGFICRKDYCGIKTKLCRKKKKRPPPSEGDDQVPPPEEIPLNKV